jgi:hypothetical protein
VGEVLQKRLDGRTASTTSATTSIVLSFALPLLSLRGCPVQNVPALGILQMKQARVAHLEKEDNRGVMVVLGRQAECRSPLLVQRIWVSPKVNQATHRGGVPQPGGLGQWGPPQPSTWKVEVGVVL